MGDELIRVEAYAGGKGAEKPVAFFVDDERVEVVDIIWRWVEEGMGDRRRKRFFRVSGSDGVERVIYYDETLKVWYCRAGKKQ